MARNGTIFLNQAEIQAILEAFSVVQGDENLIYRLLTNGNHKDGKFILQKLMKYNHGLATVQHMTKNKMGKVLVPSFVVETIETGGPRFIQLDPKTIASSLQWSPSVLFEFKRLRNETISLWKNININVIHATVEETEESFNGSVLE